VSHRQIWTDPTALEKKGSRHNPQHTGRPICGSVPSFSSKPTNELVGLSQTSVMDKLLGLLGPYHQHAIGTFNTCSWRPTHQSLTDTGGGYNLEGAGFPRTTPRPSQSTVFHFHLGGPSGLHFNQSTLTKPELNFFKELMAVMWSSDHSTIYRGLQLCLAVSNGISLAIGFLRIYRKVILCN
jgi:hypothetical protein